MNRAARALCAALLVAAASPALAFRRSEAKDDAGVVGGRCLYWAQPRLTFVMNPANANTSGCASTAAAADLARTSVLAWNAAAFAAAPANVCTSWGFESGGTVASTTVGFVEGGANQNLIVWRRGVCLGASPDVADARNCWSHDRRGTIALTTTSYRVSTGEILDADMELHEIDPADGSGYWFSCPGGGAPRCATDQPDGSCVAMDLGSTVTHEAGHMVGLAHPGELDPDGGHSRCSPSDLLATMAPSASLGETNKRTLFDDDVAGICTIYPAGKAPQAAGGVGQSGAECVANSARPPSSGGGGGCSTAGTPGSSGRSAIAALVILGAAFALRLRSGRTGEGQRKTTPA